MVHEAIPTRVPKDYKEAQALFDRALALAEHMRGDTLQPGEMSMLFYGFLTTLREDHQDLSAWACDWELVAKAARMALDGKAVVKGKIEQAHKSLREPELHAKVPPE